MKAWLFTLILLPHHPFSQDYWCNLMKIPSSCLRWLVCHCLADYKQLNTQSLGPNKQFVILQWTWKKGNESSIKEVCYSIFWPTLFENYSKLGRSKCFSNYLNCRAKNISKYKLLHSWVDPTQKVYRSDWMLADSCLALDLCWRNHARFDPFV